MPSQTAAGSLIQNRAVRMRKKIILFIVLMFLSTGVFAQENQLTEDSENSIISKNSEKIDEFGLLGECDLRSRFDNFMIAVQNNPAAKGYAIFYQGKDILPANYESGPAVHAKMFTNHLRFRRFDPSRIVIISGGFRESLSTELWLVPSGAEPPQPSATIPAPTMPTGKTLLYDRRQLSNLEDDSFSEEFILPAIKAEREAERREYEQENQTPDAEEIEEEPTEENAKTEQPTPEEIEKAKFFWLGERFGEQLKKQKGSNGVIIFYADDTFFEISKLQSHIEDGKRRIAQNSKISPDKIQIIFGGYRNSIEMEFWVVPKKGEQPKPTPEEREVEENIQ